MQVVEAVEVTDHRLLAEGQGAEREGGDDAFATLDPEAVGEDRQHLAVDRGEDAPFLLGERVLGESIVRGVLEPAPERLVDVKPGERRLGLRHRHLHPPSSDVLADLSEGLRQMAAVAWPVLQIARHLVPGRPDPGRGGRVREDVVNRTGQRVGIARIDQQAVLSGPQPVAEVLVFGDVRGQDQAPPGGEGLPRCGGPVRRDGEVMLQVGDRGAGGDEVGHQLWRHERQDGHQ